MGLSASQELAPVAAVVNRMAIASASPSRVAGGSLVPQSKRTGIRVLLAESIPLVRMGLHNSLENCGGYAVVAAVSTYREALQILQRESVDVLIACIELDDQSGINLVHAARRQQPDLRCLLLSESESEEELYMAFKVGAAGYFSKMIAPEPLLKAVQQVAEGCLLLSTDVLMTPRRRNRADKMLEQMDQPLPEPSYLPLSNRELEVVKLIAQGNGNKHIAQGLGISDQTVKNHITAILRKLGVNDRTHAAIYALQRGWISDVQT
jgi:DNA-binding NarL/FixJ family response regulator